jgi:hypothetical protein
MQWGDGENTRDGEEDDEKLGYFGGVSVPE